jgi:hypothetical protein
MENILQISGVASAILFLSLIDKNYANYWTILLHMLEKVEYKIRDKMKLSIIFQLEYLNGKNV